MCGLVVVGRTRRLNHFPVQDLHGPCSVSERHHEDGRHHRRLLQERPPPCLGHALKFLLLRVRSRVQCSLGRRAEGKVEGAHRQQVDMNSSRMEEVEGGGRIVVVAVA